MKRYTGLLLALVCCFAVGRVDAASLPTIHQVYEAAHSGHLHKAQSMMVQVLAVHPDSAKAHFVMAEIQSAEGQYRVAAQELNTARHLEPGLPFEKPQAVTALETQIQKALYGSFSSEVGGHGSKHSWVLIVLLGLCLILLMVVIRAIRRPQPAMPANSSAVPPMYGSPYNNLQGPFTPMTPYGGGGFMSNLKTGLGIGAGMAAGEALVNHFVDGNRTGIEPTAQNGMGSLSDQMNADNNLGGNDFGMNDDSSWGDDSSLGGGDDFSGMDDDGGWN